MYGKKQWRGLEVEGRYSDIMTFFVRELINNKLSVIRHILDTTNCAVTIEAANDTLKNIPVDLVNRCHIIYRIIDDAVQLLKDTDTLSIDAGWYRCHMISKMHMQETKPTSYMYDEEL
jgi:hypothetical protein